MNNSEELKREGCQQNTSQDRCADEKSDNDKDRHSQFGDEQCSDYEKSGEYQAGSSKSSQYGQNVIIIQNSSDLNLEDVEFPLVKYVKQVLASVEGQQSLFLVRGEDENESGEHTTYIIDLNTNGKQGICSSDIHNVDIGLGTDENSSLSLSPGPAMTTISTTLPSPFVNGSVSSESKTYIKHQDSPQESLSPLGSLDYQEQIEISFVSCTSQPDLSSLATEAEANVESLGTQQSQENLVLGSVQKVLPNLIEASLRDSILPTKSKSHPANQSAHFSLSSTKIVTVSPKLPRDAESHKSTDYIIHMAKKSIEEKNHSDPSLAQTNGLELATPHVEITEEKCGSDSVVTMYLSSPSKLQEKIQMLKSISPLIIMQTGDEEKSAVHDNSDSCNKMISHSSETSISSDQSSEGLVSILTSLSSCGVVYRCAECGYSSHNKHYYKQHVDLVHNEDRQHKCPYCDYAGKRRHALLEHMIVHSNQRPFMCDHCNASFRKKGHLTNHIKLHTSQRLVHCGVCNIQLPDTEAFECHLRKIHNTDKLYKCKLCDHTVVDRDSMLRHLHSHNDTAIYSCPKCPSLFHEEDALLTHMKGNHEFKFLEGRKGPDGTSKIGPNENVSQHHPTNIMCSECGFVCGDTEVMQRHMWIHIKAEEKTALQGNDVIKICPVSREEGSTTLGVLKMNVDLGQKTLPHNVVYQCSSCSFTSSDNSIFIKHMLAHKTQEKQERIITSQQATKPAQEHYGQAEDSPSTTTVQYKAKPVSFYSDNGTRPDMQKRLNSGVPFVYDKASARFRCLICGYHCEFQRTIKAHIWKHSGHQSIEYPTFDKPSRTKTSLNSPTLVVGNQMFPKQLDQISGKKEPNIKTITGSRPQNLPILRTRSGDTVQLVPVNPLTTNYNPASLIQIKNNSVILPAESGRSSAVNRYLESIAFIDTSTDSKKLKLEDSKVVSILSTNKTPNELLKPYIEKRIITSTNYQTQAAQTDCKHEDNVCSNSGTLPEVKEKCSEPSVVVEVMDTVPSVSGFTGMKSQQGSPRVVDQESCGGDSRLFECLESHGEGKPSEDSVAVLLERDQTGLDKCNLKDLHIRDPDSLKDLNRCPICDCLLTHDFKTHLVNFQKNTGEEKSATDETALKLVDSKLVSNHQNTEVQQADDTDSVESSDETITSCHSNNQQKSGICSSLLAVIEQLRERSKSESEEDKQGQHSLKKGGKKKDRQEEDTELESIDDLQNIERIIEGGGEKFRCSLCHYASHRICNIKLHMKTHRQKKPSECSLCDFSSSSPEALQEHMLKHCKVRTYACKFCPQVFNHKSTLRAHLQAHKDQEPFLCAYCVFETTSPMEYREHMQVHSGCSSRLRCPGCDSILSNKEELTAHLLKCKGSSKKTKTLSDSRLKAEMDREEESDKIDDEALPDNGITLHACVVKGCSFSSTNLKELQEHLSIHCNPSLLVCNLCDFKALHSRSLKSHMKRHANDQRYVQQPLEQYKCNLCGYVCHHLPSLKSHMWRHASDQSYSYEFTNDVINAAIDHDTRVDADGEADDPELLDRVINSERKILEGELNKCSKVDGQRPICWVTFRCCSCGFETINKAKLNIHMRSHSDIIQRALDIPRKSGSFQSKTIIHPIPVLKPSSKRASMPGDTLPMVPVKVMKVD